VLFGDETTFGLAHSLKKYSSHGVFHYLFEATDPEEASPILKKFDLEMSQLFSLNRYVEIALKITDIYKKFQTQNIQITLSGKQQSIVAIRELLYKNNIPSDIIGTKVYWGWKDDPNGKLKK
jgi:hypothetical protein